MRICSPQLGISPRSILGGEIYDREILIGFARWAHKVEVLLPFGKQSPQHRNLYITQMMYPFVYPPHLFNFCVLPYLFAIYRKRPFDILRIHSPTFLGLAAMLFKKRVPQVPVVGVYHWLGEGGTLSNYLDPYLLKFFDAIICDSHFVRKQIIRLYPYTDKKIYTIHNGVDPLLHVTSKSNLFLSRYGIKSNKVVLLFMGLFTKRKNPLFLIELMRTLVFLNQNCILFLCGKGELEGEIRNKIREYSLQKYIFIVSPLFGNDKNVLLNSADIFVHPSLKEGFSLSVIEAMAVGLPVVITDGFSAHEAIKNGITGYCCNTKSDWIENLVKLIENRHLRKKMSAASIVHVQKNFTWEIAVKKHIRIYKNIIERGVMR